jgi:hypothetical protein
MSDLEEWPQAPLLAALPPVARLDRSYDVDRLRADLAHLDGRDWLFPRIYTGEGVREVVELDWRSLPLRSIGGDPDRSDPGGPALTEFADTAWRARTPYLSALLAGIPAPLRCVRLMALGPDTVGPLHNDTKCGLPWGTVRLHVPIITTPGAALVLDGVEYRWQPGEWWYADFTRPHMVRNVDQVTRIHLVIDVHPTPALMEFFPAEFRRPAVAAGTVFAAEPLSLPAADLEGYRCGFSIPESFLSFEEPDGAFVSAPCSAGVRIEVSSAGLVLVQDGRPRVALVPVGDDEFRFSGWTMERSLQVHRNGTGVTHVTLRSRVGAQTRVRTVAVKSPATA